MAAVQADVRSRSDTVPEWFGWSEIRSLHKHSIPLGDCVAPGDTG